MDFRSTATTLKASGYPPRKADAKIAHDIVLKAIEDAGFHDKVTIKGGVVMSGITDAVRRATIDMDFDFLGYSLGDVSIRRFVQRLNRVAEGIGKKSWHMKRQKLSPRPTTRWDELMVVK